MVPTPFDHSITTGIGLYKNKFKVLQFIALKELLFSLFRSVADIINENRLLLYKNKEQGNLFQS